MRPDGDFVVGVVAVVLVVLGITAAITYSGIEERKRQIEFAKICQEDGKQVQYRETGRAIYSECK